MSYPSLYDRPKRPKPDPAVSDDKPSYYSPSYWYHAALFLVASVFCAVAVGGWASGAVMAFCGVIWTLELWSVRRADGRRRA